MCANQARSPKRAGPRLSPSASSGRGCCSGSLRGASSPGACPSFQRGCSTVANTSARGPRDCSRPPHTHTRTEQILGPNGCSDGGSEGQASWHPSPPTQVFPAARSRDTPVHPSLLLQIRFSCNFLRFFAVRRFLILSRHFYFRASVI